MKQRVREEKGRGNNHDDTKDTKNWGEGREELTTGGTEPAN